MGEPPIILDIIFILLTISIICSMPPDKGCLTYDFEVNSDGTNKCQALIIGRAHKPVWFCGKTGKQLGFYYSNNTKAWMQTGIFIKWIESWDRELRLEDRKILLLVDNFAGHWVNSHRPLTNIQLKLFSPNLTSHFQPLDTGSIANFKCY